jgi:hypothetical protein
MRLITSLTILVLLSVTHGGAVWAQSTQVLPEAVIEATRGVTIDGAAPIQELLPAELDSYGVDTLSDLVDALKPITRSSRSDQMPVVLINGHLAGQIEFQTLPREAIERVQVLPETVALQYGFSENQRVLNFILREHYRALVARLTDTGATEGGAQTQQADASLAHIEGDTRSTLYGIYTDAAWLRDSDRGITVPDSDALTLQPAKTDTWSAGTLSRSVLGVSSSLEGALSTDATRSLQGVSSDGQLLHQSAHDLTGRLATQLTGQWGHAIWGLTASYTREQSRSETETGFDAGNEALSDRTSSTYNAGSLQLSLSGPLLRLPAGPLVANFKLGYQYQGFDSDTTFPGIPAHSNLIRSIRTGNLNANIPVSAVGGPLPLGDLSATLNVTLDNVSDVGPLWSISYGLDWIPLKAVHLDVIVTDHASAPTVQQVLAPPIVTPNVETFDFTNGETVYLTEITGGGGTLQPTYAQTQSFGLALGPFRKHTVFSAHYEQNRVRNDVGALPPLTPDVEQAFPERFIRDAQGTLIELDDRAVNLQRERIDDLKWGFNVWLPLGDPNAAKGTPDRVEVSAFDTWYLRDTILVRDGVPILNLLNGAPSDVTGGQPRHKLEFRTLVYKDGIGGTLNAGWRSATQVGSGDPLAPDTLFFSALATVDLRVSTDFERFPPTRGDRWAKGARLSFTVINLFDRRQSVHDAGGVTPVAFEPGYLDPAGRLLRVGIRKVF